MKPRILAGLLAVLMVGCVPKVQQPDVWLAGARLGSIGFTGGVVNVQLSVYNPNRFDFRASGLTYDIDLEHPDGDGWINFTEGRLDRRLEVAAGDTVMIEIPVEFEYRRLGQALRGLLDQGSFDYRVRGVVALEGPVRRDFSYRHAGAVTPSGVR